MIDNAVTCKIQSVERAMKILRCFYTKKEIGLSELSRMVGIPKSTVFSLADSLVACSMLSQNSENGKYRLGIELLKLGSMVDIDLCSIAMPYMKKLSAKYQENVNLTKFTHDHITYIEQIGSLHAVGIITDRGQDLELHCCAVGKAILASMDEETLKSTLPLISYTRYTGNTISNEKDLLAELEIIRAKGYGINNQESAPEVYTVGVVLRDVHGKPCGGLSVSGPKIRMNPAVREKELAEDLIHYASEINRAFSKI